MGIGCARPRLLLLGGDGGRSAGPLLLSGGRLTTEQRSGIFLWVRYEGGNRTLQSD